MCGFCTVIGLVAYITTLDIELPKLSKTLLIASDEKPDEQLLYKDAMLQAANQVKVHSNGRDYHYQLSIDSDLQAFVQKKMRKHQLDWAGVAVLESKTGRVLSLNSFAKTKALDPTSMSLRATFPAASIFKVITAGALLEETLSSSESVFQYAGNMKKINAKNLKSPGKGTVLSLKHAFADSANGIFGIIGTSHLNLGLLETYGQQFGFGHEIPFEIPVQTSALGAKKEDASSWTDVDTARLAAGFGKVTLSPLHGAMIASSVIGDGKMMRPTLVDQVAIDGEASSFRQHPEVWLRPLSKSHIPSMKNLMRQTVQTGTARRPFKNIKEHKVMSKLDIGGKTGSLYGSSPKGRHEWFIAYGHDPKTDQGISIGIVIVSEKYWKVKPAQLAYWIFERYFEQRGNLQKPLPSTSPTVAWVHEKERNIKTKDL